MGRERRRMIVEFCAWFAGVRGCYYDAYYMRHQAPESVVLERFERYKAVLAANPNPVASAKLAEIGV